MQPPPQPTGGRPILDPTKMKTILTTRVAVAMDPRTESGTDELLGIYLEQNTGTHVPPAERELQRGLKQSPEKASKSKSAKFTRWAPSADLRRFPYLRLIRVTQGRTGRTRATHLREAQHDARAMVQGHGTPDATPAGAPADRPRPLPADPCHPPCVLCREPAALAERTAPLCGAVSQDISRRTRGTRGGRGCAGFWEPGLGGGASAHTGRCEDGQDTAYMATLEHGQDWGPAYRFGRSQYDALPAAGSLYYIVLHPLSHYQLKVSLLYRRIVPDVVNYSVYNTYPVQGASCIMCISIQRLTKGSVLVAHFRDQHAQMPVKLYDSRIKPAAGLSSGGPGRTLLFGHVSSVSG